MVIEYRTIKRESIDDEIILNELEKYIAKYNISIETESELVYTVEDFLEEYLSGFLGGVSEFLDWSYDFERYKHLIDNSNYVKNPHTCCDDYSNYNYCPICGTKLK